MKRKITALLLAAALIFALLPTAVVLASDEWDGETGIQKWRYDSSTQTLIIGGAKGEMGSYIGDLSTGKTMAPWSQYCEQIENIIFTGDVSNVGMNAFYGCSNLKNVELASTVSRIEAGAFSNCTSLEHITIPNNVTIIGGSAFERCSSLREITIPNRVTKIGMYGFFGCYSLSSIMIPEHVSNIGAAAFAGCFNLEEINVSENNPYFSSDDSGALYNKDKTELIFYPYVRQGAYTIPGSVTKIDEDALLDRNGLTDISVDSSNEYFQSMDGALYTKDGLSLLVCPAGKSGTFSVANGVESICSNAFSGCMALTEVIISDSVTEIKAETFLGLPLKRVVIGNNVTNIGWCAFSYCSELSTITIPTNITKIENGAFNQCNSLKDVYYSGTEDDWNRIQVEDGNDCLLSATKHFGQAEPDTPPMQFNDIPGNAWYIDAVNYAVSNGLMNGISSDKFAPDNTMTRSMLVTVLWRYAGKPAQGSSSFTDVPGGIWYAQAVAWASSNGIVNGIGGGKFNPDGNITREQLSAILYRFAQNRGSYTGARGDLSAFPDSGSVSGWAKDAMNWAVGAGLINGSDGKLLPQGNATRAQVAAILMRYIENTVH